MQRGHFDNLKASELFCPRCRALRKVREKLLLLIPGGELHSYICMQCGETLGTREIRKSSAGVSLRA